ncbi:MAG TPA: FAD-dependent oxidoreductase [Candidatus Bipolaricaulis sp.]|nr:FAD-dependent oxidoreductase [Candidatus Bipolaricaulis sp.]HRS13803.1 FAD-dependent oxidoreductase [Candidatus Bipolaricaulis sp.]HRU21489.1 FAD-dependent oxidoreductase [Candidatus Bipolaricaulis sp.]
MAFVVVGGGLAGFTAARTVRSLEPGAEIAVVEAEPAPYYLRPGLIEVLAGRKTLAEITPFPRAWFEHRRIAFRSGVAAVCLDPRAHRLCLSSGEKLAYERLLLACGAEAVQPEVPGVHLEGVFTLRSAADAERIRTRAEAVAAAAVIGGGWLGIEVARALHDLGLAVTLLERGPWLLNRQLDEGAARILTGILADLGIEVRVRATCAAVLGTTEVTGILLADGEEVRAGLVVTAAGVRPRIALAAEAGLATGRGVIVDDYLATSDPDVFAAGDVAEWRGHVYGIVPAARDQGEVAARNMVQPRSVQYPGTPPSNKLKVAGVDLLCLGNTQPQGGPLREMRHADPAAGRYVKFVLGEDGELAGAILLGAADLAGPVEELAQAGVPAEDDLKLLLAF